MLLEHPQFSKLVRTADWTKNIAAIVIDEAHCITMWGNEFRTEYRKLNKLGKVPTFEGSDGYILSECLAIAIYRKSHRKIGLHVRRLVFAPAT